MMHAKAIHMEEMHSRTYFGFWTYLMTDCVLFATLFATYAVLHNNTYGGPSGRELFSLPFALTESLILLTSSFTCGLSMLGAHRNEKSKVIGWFAVTFLLGICFLAMEWHEFAKLVREGNSWRSNAFLSSYFTLVGTHGLHVAIGLLWMVILLIPVMRRGLRPVSIKRLTCLRLFWHFLDVVWIFIFTFVYLKAG